MEGVISNFRRSKHTTSGNHLIIVVKGVDSKEKALKLVGKKVVWKTQTGKEIKGIIKASHGAKGAVRAIFESGMPGQSISTKVSID